MEFAQNLIAVIIFYNKSQGPSQRLAFSSEFRHCNTITYDGDDWIMTEFLPSGLLIRRVKCKDGPTLVEKLRIIPEATAIISLAIDPRKKVPWFPWWVRSCNEVCRYVSGADTGWTFNPWHLYRKLIKYDQRRNWTVLSHWRRTDGRKRRSIRPTGGGESPDSGRD
jgi:hypothetical protein